MKDIIDLPYHTQAGDGIVKERKRIRIWTPDDRAAHRVFEKGRREAFNDNVIVSCLSINPSF